VEVKRTQTRGIEPPGAGRAAPHKSQASAAGGREMLQEHLEIAQWDSLRKMRIQLCKWQRAVRWENRRVFTP